MHVRATTIKEEDFYAGLEQDFQMCQWSMQFSV